MQRKIEGVCQAVAVVDGVLNYADRVGPPRLRDKAFETLGPLLDVYRLDKAPVKGFKV